MAASGGGSPEAPSVSVGYQLHVRRTFLEVSESMDHKQSTDTTDHKQSTDPTGLRQDKAKDWWQPALQSVRINNIPDTCDQDMFVTLLSREGFDGEFDFVYWPKKVKGHSQGYVVVDLRCPSAARNLLKHFDGFNNWGMGIEAGQPAVTAWNQKLAVKIDIPEAYNRDMLVTLLKNEGFGGQFDFLYLPYKINGKLVTDTPLGYAIVNFRCPLWALKFLKHFDGFDKWGIEGGQPAVTKWYQEHGKENHIKRYRDSDIMHPDVAETKKPMVFHDGIPEPFPRPTRELQLPSKQKRRTHGRRRH